MFTKKFSLLNLFTGVLLIALAVMFTSCNPEVPEDNSFSLTGKWESQYGDGYEITETQITYDDGGWGFGWTGKIEEITADCIFYSIENSYFAVGYKNLTATSCSFSNAFKQDGAVSEPTLAEAKTEFTVANGYFAYYSECVKTE